MRLNRQESKEAHRYLQHILLDYEFHTIDDITQKMNLKMNLKSNKIEGMIQSIIKSNNILNIQKCLNKNSIIGYKIF